MSRPYGSRNRTKIPQTSEVIKYASQNLRDTLIFLEGIINSTDGSITIKNKLDASELNRKILEMSGYGKELEAGLDKIIDEEGEDNKFRNTLQPPKTPNIDTQGVKDTTSQESPETPNLDMVLSRFEEE